MSKKINKLLLSEELNKFRMISEYSFYTGDDKDLITSNGLDEAEDAEAPEDDLEPVDTNVDAEADDVAGELGVDAEDGSEGSEGMDDLEGMDDNGGEDLNAAPDAGTDMNATPEAAPEAQPQGGEGEVEIDVTELVNSSEQSKQAADQSNAKVDQLLTKFAELEGKLNNMGKIEAKIDSLEHEVEKRIPTPAEKLEMQSLNSYPYSLKLTDYWSEKEGAYDVMDNGQPKKQEYTLTKKDVDSSYSESGIKNSFDVSPDFEEEDI